MSRADITAGLSALVEKHLSKNGRPWAKEVTMHTLGGIRPDYMSVNADWGGIAEICHIERATVSVYEVKSCMADVKSGNGLNAIGDHNWLVLPYELHRELVMSDDNPAPCWFGKAWPVPEGCGFGDLDYMPAYEGQADGWELHWAESHYPAKHHGRKAPLVAYLWAMMYAGVRR